MRLMRITSLLAAVFSTLFGMVNAEGADHHEGHSQGVSGFGSSLKNLQMIKQLLNNGHILTFKTHVDSWNMTTVGHDPLHPTNPHKGQLAVSWIKSHDGGHRTTVIGYNDEIWIDINGNGVVDPGEKGAFLLDNSSIDEWGSQDFVWVAYDAFLTESAVENGPNTARVSFAGNLDYKMKAVLLLMEAP